MRPWVVPYQREWIFRSFLLSASCFLVSKDGCAVGRTNFLVVARANPGTVPVPVQGGGRFYPPRGGGVGASCNAVWPKGTRAPCRANISSNRRAHRCDLSRTEAQLKRDQILAYITYTLQLSIASKLQIARGGLASKRVQTSRISCKCKTTFLAPTWNPRKKTPNVN